LETELRGEHIDIPGMPVPPNAAVESTTMLPLRMMHALVLRTMDTPRKTMLKVHAITMDVPNMLTMKVQKLLPLHQDMRKKRGIMQRKLMMHNPKEAAEPFPKSQSPGEAQVDTTRHRGLGNGITGKRTRAPLV
jgi:hypothetical protein